MIDFWRLIGTMFTDDAFRYEILDRFAGKHYPYDKAASGFEIEEEHYEALRAIVERRFRPVSLFCLGELLVALSRPGVRVSIEAVATALKKTGRVSARPSAEFLTALGALVVDDAHTGVTARAPDDRASYYGILSDETAIYRDISRDPDLLAAARDLCRSCWARGCYVKAAYYYDYIQPGRESLQQEGTQLV